MQVRVLFPALILKGQKSSNLDGADDSVRPSTEEVSVQSAEIAESAASAIPFVSNGPDSSLIIAKATSVRKLTFNSCGQHVTTFR